MVVAKEEIQDELRTRLAEQVAPTRAEPCCVSYDFQVDAEDPDRFMFYENWRSKADLDAHLRVPNLKPSFDRVDELLSEPVRIRFYEMLSSWDDEGVRAGELRTTRASRPSMTEC
jgi:quinol monooxygenase YgiN